MGRGRGGRLAHSLLPPSGRALQHPRPTGADCAPAEALIVTERTDARANAVTTRRGVGHNPLPELDRGRQRLLFTDAIDTTIRIGPPGGRASNAWRGVS